MAGTARAVFRFFLFAIFLMLLLPVQCVLLLVSPRNFAYRLPVFWHKLVCAIFGIRIRQHGTAFRKSPCLYVCNHLSYLDIPVLGSLLNSAFVAKEDVASWPLLGLLAKLQQTVFVSRSPKSARKEKEHLSERILQGRNLILFPEGTSSDGRNVLPFRSTFFSLAYHPEVKDTLTIQPVSIALSGIAQDNPDIYAWYGEMDLLPHLWTFAKSSGVDLEIRFLPVQKAQEKRDRKALALSCHSEIVHSVRQTQNR